MVAICFGREIGREIRAVYSHQELRFSRGTPQGGIISPFIFADIIIFDMSLFVLFGVLFNYADDSTSVLSARTTDFFCKCKIVC